jgi:hypothetical protein
LEIQKKEKCALLMRARLEAFAVHSEIKRRCFSPMFRQITQQAFFTFGYKKRLFRFLHTETSEYLGAWFQGRKTHAPIMVKRGVTPMWQDIPYHKTQKIEALKCSGF